MSALLRDWLASRWLASRASVRMGSNSWVAGGVVDHDLLDADAGDQLSAQMDAGRAEPVHGAGRVGDFDGEPIPPSRCGQGAVRHGLPAA